MDELFNTVDAKQVNRISDAIQIFTEQEAKHKIEYPTDQRSDRHSLELRKNHFESIIKRYDKQKGLTPDEKQSLRYARHELRRTNAKLQPTVFKSILYNRIINRLINAILGTQRNFSAHDELFSTKEQNTFLENNILKLLKSLKKRGFQLNMEGPLRRIMVHVHDEFSMRYLDPKYPEADCVLYFKKIPGTEAFYFKKIDVAYHPDLESIIKNDPKTPRLTFNPLDKAKFTFPEIAKITSQHPVMKVIDGREYWFTARNVNSPSLPNAPFDLEKELTRWPIAELDNPSQKDALMNGLQSGNHRDISFKINDEKIEKMRVGVRADIGGLVFYNKSGQVIDAYSRLEKNPNLERWAKKFDNNLQQGQEKTKRQRTRIS